MILPSWPFRRDDLLMQHNATKSSIKPQWTRDFSISASIGALCENGSDLMEEVRTRSITKVLFSPDWTFPPLNELIYFHRLKDNCFLSSVSAWFFYCVCESVFVCERGQYYVFTLQKGIFLYMNVYGHVYIKMVTLNYWTYAGGF